VPSISELINEKMPGKLDTEKALQRQQYFRDNNMYDEAQSDVSVHISNLTKYLPH
jgi:hypothetical protein